MSPSGQGGLAVFDLSHLTNCVRVGGYDTSGDAWGVAVSGNYPYIADGDAGLQVIDVSNPTNCMQWAAVTSAGLPRSWLPTLANLQFTVRVVATTNETFTLQTTTKLTPPITWTNLLTTNVPPCLSITWTST